MTSDLALPNPYQLPNISGANTDKQLISLWLRGKKSQHTKRAYEQDLKLFGDFCETLPLEPEDDLPARPESLRDVKAVHVQLFIEHLTIEKDAAPATVKRRLAALKSLLSYAQKTGYLPFNVAVVVSAPDAHRDILNKILSVAQVEALLQNVAGRDRALLHYMYYSGVRVSEATKLRVRDLYRPTDKQLTVTVIGKRNKQRIIPLPVDKIWPVLGPFVPTDKDAWVFPGRGGQHLSESRAYKIVKLAARLAGCPHASPHCLRHSHASHAIRNGAPVHVIQQTLGHANVATTSVYLHAEAGESSGMYL